MHFNDYPLSDHGMFCGTPVRQQYDLPTTLKLSKMQLSGQSLCCAIISQSSNQHVCLIWNLWPLAHGVSCLAFQIDTFTACTAGVTISSC